ERTRRCLIRRDSRLGALNRSGRLALQRAHPARVRLMALAANRAFPRLPLTGQQQGARLALPPAWLVWSFRACRDRAAGSITNLSTCGVPIVVEIRGLREAIMAVPWERTKIGMFGSLRERDSFLSWMGGQIASGISEEIEPP